jgi:nitroreductase
MESTTLMHDLLAGRWSPSIFDPAHHISDAQVESLLTAAQWAPSAGNSQPWAYVVCRRGDDHHRRFVRHLSRGNSGWVPTASIVFVTLCQTATDPMPDAPSYSDYAAYDTGQAAAHITIQARLLGLDAHQFAGFDHEAVTAEFEIPSNFEVMTGIAVGRHGDADVVAAASERDQEREQRDRVRRPVRLF